MQTHRTTVSHDDVLVLVLQVIDQVLKVLLDELPRAPCNEILCLKFIIESYICLLFVAGILLVRLGVVFYR